MKVFAVSLIFVVGVWCTLGDNTVEEGDDLPRGLKNGGNDYDSQSKENYDSTKDLKKKIAEFLDSNMKDSHFFSKQMSQTRLSDYQYGHLPLSQQNGRYGPSHGHSDYKSDNAAYPSAMHLRYDNPDSDKVNPLSPFIRASMENFIRDLICRYKSNPQEVIDMTIKIVKPLFGSKNISSLLTPDMLMLINNMLNSFTCG